MKRCFAFMALAGALSVGHAEEIVIDFEQAEIGKPMPAWSEKGVTFKLATPLKTSKAAGRIMFFPHIATNHKGILNAMATEQAIPVQATLPNGAAALPSRIGAARSTAASRPAISGTSCSAGATTTISRSRSTPTVS